MVSTASRRFHRSPPRWWSRWWSNPSSRDRAISNPLDGPVVIVQDRDAPDRRLPRRDGRNEAVPNAAGRRLGVRCPDGHCDPSRARGCCVLARGAPIVAGSVALVWWATTRLNGPVELVTGGLRMFHVVMPYGPPRRFQRDGGPVIRKCRMLRSRLARGRPTSSPKIISQHGERAPSDHDVKIARCPESASSQT